MNLTPILPSGQTETCTYDEGAYGKGRLTRINDGSGQTTFTYSAAGELVTQVASVNGQTYTTSWNYDTAGRLLGMSYPTGVSLGYSYDSYSPLGVVTGTPGEIKADTKSPEACKTISTSADQDKKMSKAIAQAQSSIPSYRVVGNSCVNFVQSVLSKGGVSTPPSTTPSGFFSNLPGN